MLVLFGSAFNGSQISAGGSGEKLGALLVTLGVVAQRDVAEALAAQLDLPLIEAAGYPELPILEERVSARFLREKIFRHRRIIGRVTGTHLAAGQDEGAAAVAGFFRRCSAASRSRNRSRSSSRLTI